jgi:hypothetical protein
MTIMERRGGRTLHLRKITGGARIPGCQRAAASGAAELAIPARPQGSRRCTRLAVATTLPCVIELGSVCAVRAPGIVA